MFMTHSNTLGAAPRRGDDGATPASAICCSTPSPSSSMPVSCARSWPTRARCTSARPVLGVDPRLAALVHRQAGAPVARPRAARHRPAARHRARRPGRAEGVAPALLRGPRGWALAARSTRQPLRTKCQCLLGQTGEQVMGRLRRDRLSARLLRLSRREPLGARPEDGRILAAMPDDAGTKVNIKPRSCEVTDGYERAPARAMLRAVGMTDDDWDKPQVGVRLVVERGHARATCRSTGWPSGPRSACATPGGFPIEFTTIAVSDGISMGHEGMRAVAREPRGHRRLGRDRDARRAASTRWSRSPVATSRFPAC